MSSCTASQSFNRIIGRAESTPQADSLPVPTALIVVATICLVFTLFAVGARAITKSRHWRREFDDFAIIIAEAGFVAFFAMSFDLATEGEGTSVSKLSGKSIQRVRFLTNILSLIYVPTVLATKVAILVQAARFFTTVQRRTKYCMTFCLIAVSVAGYTAIFFLRLFACTPRAKISNLSVDGKCLPKYTDAITAGAFGITSNVAIVLALWSICPKLQFDRTKKILIIFIMIIGVFACGCSILQLVYGLKLATSQDYTKAVLPINLLALAELAGLIIIACCPTLPHGLELLARRNQSEKSIIIHDQWYNTLSSGSDSPMSKKSSERISPRPLILPTITERPRTAPAPQKSPMWERRISHLSHHTVPPSRQPSSRTLAPPSSPGTPVSPAFSVRDAWEMKVTPMKVTPICAFGNIKRTIQVRVSNHTNRGSRSPVQWGAPDPKWEMKW